MVVGEKLWEGKGKMTGMAIRATGPEGVTIESTWVAQLKGMGRAKGVDGAVTFTDAVLSEPPAGAGWAHGQGIFNTMTGDMVIIKGIWIRQGRNGQEQERWAVEFHDDVPET